jgi:hypothetical protein
VTFICHLGLLGSELNKSSARQLQWTCKNKHVITKWCHTLVSKLIAFAPSPDEEEHTMVKRTLNPLRSMPTPPV